MINLFKLTVVFLSLTVRAQISEQLFNNYFNPTALQEVSTPFFCSKIESFDREFHVKNNLVIALFSLQKRMYGVRHRQYGYKHYKDAQYSISTSQKLNRTMNMGINLNYHHLFISNSNKYNALSFDLSYSYKSEKHGLGVVVQNPLNSQYFKEEINSRLILIGTYHWSANLFSEVHFEESLHNGLNIRYQLSYSYKQDVKLSLLQAVHPLEYGFRFGLKKNKIQLFSQFKRLTWTTSIGFAFIYQLGNE